MTTYLAPTDFSQEAAAAVGEAARRAQLNDAELILLHVFEVPADASQVARPRHFPNLQEEVRRGAELQLQALRDELVADRAPTRLVLLDGEPADCICSVAEEEGVDLIVLATHGHGGIRRFFLGSTAERVMRYAPCSVLVYKPRDAGAAADASV